ncbi:hypothetical protein LTR36_005599 [Oleoguttula mirabilis]|uniref:RNA-dependent RNA polymerase n=1 Tax=Oleoguttula mirabilis TaxID=1507867 RepID=A0AAV9JF98_9PEZI|nr:hypothetical protein LTR36_005599 [Oleoguttula mirabilis]
MVLSPKRQISPAGPTTPKRPTLPPHLRPNTTPPHLRPHVTPPSPQPNGTPPHPRPNGTPPHPCPRPTVTTAHLRPDLTPPQQNVPPRPSLMNRPLPWANAAELKVQLKRLPDGWGTLQVYNLLRHLGNLDRIEVNLSRGERFVNGYVIFRPAPQNAHWIYRGLTITDQHGIHQIETFTDWSPRRTGRTNCASPERKSLSCVPSPMTQLDAGMMQTEEHMLIMFTARPISGAPLTAAVKMERNMLEVLFGVETHGDRVVTRKFKLCMNFSQIRHASELSSRDGSMAFLLTMEMPPLLFRQTTEVDDTHDKKVLAWNESQTWFRQTGIDERPHDSSTITQLRKDSVILDVGRWLTYRFAFSDTEADRATFQSIGKALIDHNVPLTSMSQAVFTSGKVQDLWAWSDDPTQLIVDGSSASVLSDLHMMGAPLLQLEFSVRYQLEVCLSHGVFRECNMRPDFLSKLATIEAARAAKLLEKAADDKKRFHDPMDVFRLQGQVSVRQKKIPRYCAMVPAAVVTPTTIYFTTPVMETSNRVIREFRQYGDRFLRVKFTDERYKGRIMTGDGNTMDEVLTRVYRTMKNGIRIGGRHYDFLAFGNAQFREHGAYFFSSVGTVTADKIRQWMGNFTKIQVVAKYASRIGQCFSTTRAMSIGVKIEPIPDIERNGFCFTDGVGKISPFLAQMIADEFGLPNSSTDYPSVFQFRLGGCKGVLAVDPAIKGQVVQIRPSQEKFPAKYHGLEICRTSQFSSANLNVQIILVLNALGVKDEAFRKKMRETLSDLLAAMTDERKATEQLHRNIDFSQTTLVLADMIYDGFMTGSEPFMISCLRLWHSWMVKYLKEKARIPVEHGAFIIGCVDETATLKGHYYTTHGPHLQLSDPASLPEVFLQIPVPEGKGKYRIIEGVCVLARNPSLHPGDIRVVRAVDAPKLHHLRNCVVLPQTGDRDLGNMCSGGDLDGDDYLVMWDSELIPEEWNHAPMDYEAPPPVVSDGPVTVDAITSFFVNHMKNDNLGRIAMAHRYWADAKEEGVKNQNCLDLAQLHSMAVDYAKTGVAATMPKQLHVRRYPHWAEKRNTYQSTKVLGQLYDMVQRKDFHAAWDLPFEKRILDAYELSDELLHSALGVKLQYDEAVRRVMAQHGIKTEFEVYTTFVLRHDSDIGDYKFAETLAETVSGLKQCHQELCYEKAGTTARERDWAKMGPFIAAMYAVTARQVTAALAANNETRLVGGQLEFVRETKFDNMPFMSYPWIFAKELGHIATKRSPTAAMAVMQSTTLPRKTVSKKTNMELLGDDFVLEPLQDVSTAEGIVHEGDVLNIHHKEDVVTHANTHSLAHGAGPVSSFPAAQVTASVTTVSDEQQSADKEPEAHTNGMLFGLSGEAHSTSVHDAPSKTVAPPVAPRSAEQPSTGLAAQQVTESGEEVDAEEVGVEGEEVVIAPEEQGSALDALHKLVGF